MRKDSKSGGQFSAASANIQFVLIPENRLLRRGGHGFLARRTIKILNLPFSYRIAGGKSRAGGRNFPQ